jgi:glycosyltransferase involved in cell wall biosynthesis
VPIVFNKQIEPSERFDFLDRSSILVFPSYYPSEAFPLVILEAMRCGNVIIATDHNYLPLIVKANNGKLVPPKDSIKLAGAIMDYLNEPGNLERTCAFNIAHAKKEYAENKYTDSILRLLA